MRKLNQSVSVLFLLLVLVAGLCPAQTAKKKPEEVIPDFNIPRMEKAPTIDGRIHEDEWDQAVRLTGVVQTGNRRFRDRPVIFWVAWDPQHLYIAARSDILPGHRMWKQKRQKYTTGVVYDDSYEYGLFLHGRNQQEGEAMSFMKFIINSLGAGEYMKVYPSIGQNMFNWRPTMDIANDTYEADGKRWWDQEIAMDLEDLQMPRKHRPGDKIDMLLAADLKNPGWQWLDIYSASGHLEHHGFPRGTLTESEPYVRVHEFGGLHDGKLDFRATIHNPSDEPVKLDVRARIVHGPKGQVGPAIAAEEEDKVEIYYEKNPTLTIPPRGQVEFTAQKDLAGLEYDKEEKHWKQGVFSAFDIHVRPAGQADARPIYEYNVLFRPNNKGYLNAKPRTVDFVTGHKFNPAQNKLFLRGDTLDASIPEGTEPAAMTYKVMSAEDGNVIAEGRTDTCAYYRYEKLLDLGDLAPGEYTVRLALVDESGEELISKQGMKFAKKDESKAFSKWWNNDIGSTDTLLKPFEPLEVSRENGTVIAPTRRRYHLDGLGLPRQIESNGGKVLTGPARIIVQIDGKQHTVPADVDLKITGQKDHRVDFENSRPVSVGGVEFSVKGHMEQDGMVYLDLTYGPADDPVAVERLRVEYPVDDTLGLHMACMGKGNYCPRTIGEVPAGTGKVWSTKDDIGLGGTGMTRGSFMPNLWVGTEKRGLLWTGNTDQGWVPRNEITAHALLREDNSVIIRNNIIGTPEGEEPFKLTEARTVHFEYNASPFRKLIDGWRINQVSSANGFTRKPKYKWNWDTGEEYFTVLSPPFKDTSRWEEYWDHCEEVANKQAKSGLYRIRSRLRPYLNNQIALRGYGRKSLEPGVYDYFGGDWSGDTLSKTQRDYFIWLQNEHITKGGVTHYYYDITFTGFQYTNPAAGLGYRLGDGRLQPEFGDENLRQWYKRVWAQMQENGLYPGGVSGHSTNSICLKALPFTDAILDSEYPMQDPIDVFPSERMIALSCSHNFGVTISHLGHMNVHWAAMHDANRGGSGYPFASAAFKRWGIARGDVEYVPYWRNDHLVEESTDGVLVSMWKRPETIVFGLTNYGDGPGSPQKTRSVEIDLDLKALGIPPGLDGDRLRIREFLNDRIIDEKLSQMDWVKAKPKVPHPKWGKRIKVKLRDPISPQINGTSGLIHGFDLHFHDTRYVVLHWEDGEIDEEKLNVLTETGADRRRLLEWGLNDAAPLPAPRTRKLISRAPQDVQVRAWTRPEGVMLQITNPGKEAVTAELEADLDALGVKVHQRWRQFAGINSMDGQPARTTLGRPEKIGNAMHYDGYTGKVWVKLDGNETRVVALERY